MLCNNNKAIESMRVMKLSGQQKFIFPQITWKNDLHKLQCSSCICVGQFYIWTFHNFVEKLKFYFEIILTPVHSNFGKNYTLSSWNMMTLLSTTTTTHIFLGRNIIFPSEWDAFSRLRYKSTHRFSSLAFIIIVMCLRWTGQSPMHTV